MKELAEWDSFYLIVGGAAGALIGLQFVVMTLLADRQVDRESQAGHAFATPTITQFTAALLLSALVRIPFKTIGPISVSWGVIGIAGIFYTAIVIRRIATGQPGAEGEERLDVEAQIGETAMLALRLRHMVHLFQLMPNPTSLR